MQSRGLVRREPDKRDKRVLRLYLTEDGEALLQDALKIHLNLVERAMAGTSEKECDVVGKAMNRVAAAVTETEDSA